MVNINLLIQLIEKNTERSKNNKIEIKRLNDADNSILELIKSILEKISEVVEILNRRKNKDIDPILGTITGKIKTAKGGDQSE